MSINTLVIGLLLANAVLHVISYFELEHQQSNQRWGALAFVLINALLAALFTRSLIWARYLAIVFPLIGGIGLLTQLKSSKIPKWINYAILIVDAAIVGLVSSMLLN